MAFASSLALSTVCVAYGITPQSLKGLAGQAYYTSNTSPATGVAVSLPVSLQSFSSKYISSSGTLPNTTDYGSGGFFEEAFAQNGTLGHGVEARAGWNTFRYTMSSNKLISISANFYLNGTGTGSGTSGVGTNSPRFTFTADGVSHQSTSTGNYSPTIAPSSSTFTIQVQGNASNGFGDQAGADKTWSFTISSTGLNHS